MTTTLQSIERNGREEKKREEKRRKENGREEKRSRMYNCNFTNMTSKTK